MINYLTKYYSSINLITSLYNQLTSYIIIKYLKKLLAINYSYMLTVIILIINFYFSSFNTVNLVILIITIINVIIINFIYRNPSFGLATKAKGLQGYGPRRSLGVTSHAHRSVGKCEGVNPHTPKSIPILGDGVPVDSRNFREQFERSKLNFLWRSLYHWKPLRT